MKTRDLSVVILALVVCGAIAYPLDAGSDCSDCTAFMKDFKNTVMNNRKVVNDWTKMLDTECETFGSGMGPLCKSMVSQYFPQVLDGISQMEVSTICTDLTMCNSLSQIVGDQCMDCKSFFTDVQAKLKASESMDKINGEIIKECDQLGEGLKQMCASLLKKNLPMLWQSLEQMDVAEACTSLEFCTAHMTEVEIALLPVLMELEFTDRKDSNPIIQENVDCEVCQLVAKELDSLVSKSSTESEIEQALEDVCGILPAAIKTECDSLVEEYGPQIVQMLVNELAPDVICVQLKLCGQNTQQVVNSRVGDSTECDVCKLLAQELDKVISKDSTEAEIEKALEDVCGILPSSIKSTCQSLVSEYGDAIVQLLVKELSPDAICQELKLCGQSNTETEVSKVQDSTECDVCKLLTQELDKLVSKDSTEAEIEKALEDVCGILPSSIKSTCQSLVSEYGDLIVQLLVKELSPDAVCKELKLCGQSYTEVVAAEVQDSTECDVCKLLAQELDKVISKDSTEAEIKKALEGVCGILPSSIKTTCQSLVDEYGDAIVQLLVKELSPDAVCKELKLCGQSDTEVVAVEVQDSTECDVCKLLAQELDKLISKDSTEAEIEKALEDVCGILPSSIKSTCQSLVSEYGDLIVQLLVKELSPDAICQELKLCSESSTEVVALKVQDSTECDVCKLLAQELDKLVSKDSTEAEIEKALEDVCSILPSSIKSTCQSLVSEYGDLIVQLLVKELSPDAVCKELKLCGQSSTEVIAAEVQDSTECDVCKLVAQELDQLVSKDSTEAEIEKALDDVCGILPSSIKSTCQSLVSEYGDAIVQLLVKELAPDTICQELKLCGGSNTEVVVAEVQDSTECDVCKLVAQELDQLVSKDSTESEIEAALEKVCSILPGSIKDECDSLVQEYGPQIVQLLIKELAPDVVCVQLKLCVQVAATDVRLESTQCDVCKLVVGELNHAVTTDSTEAEIEQALEKTCKILPKDLRSDCSNVVDQFGHLIVELLRKEVAPEQICVDIKLCTANCVELQGDPCGDCKNFMGDLQDTIKNNPSLVQEIVDLVKQECDQLGPGLGDVCKKFVDQYTPEIEKVITGNDVGVICSTIDMCMGYSNLIGGDICTDCQAFLSDWQGFIVNNPKVINDVSNLIKQQCDSLGSEFSKLCETAVQQYLPQLWDAISDTDPEEACAAVYFCDFEERSNPIIDTHEVQGDACGDCKNFMGDLQDTIKNNPSLVQEIVDLVKDECGQLGPGLDSVCKKLIDQYTPDIENAITGNDVGVICSTIDMCMGSSDLVGGDICSDCQAFLSDWQGYVVNNQSIINDVSNLIKQQCDSLGSEFSKVCQTAVQQYLPQLWDAISDTDPEEACAAVYFCDLEKTVSQTLQDDGELECNACKFVIQEVEKMVGEDKTEENIAEALTVVCDLYGEDIRDECKSFVEQHGDDLIDFIILEMNSLEICTKLGLCKSGVRSEKKIEDDTECDVCNLVFTELEKYISKQSTEQEIANALGSICRHLGKAEKECDMIVHEYGPTLISLISQELSPSETCSAIKLCSSEEKDTVESSELECEVCKVVADELDKLLKEGSTKAEIQHALDQVCGIVPSQYRDTCSGLIQQYGPEIIALLINEVEPQTICPQLKLCPTAVVKVSKSEIECKVCSLVAKEVDSLLKEGSTQEEIEDTLRKVCGLLPGNLKSSCDNLIAEGGPMIIAELIKGMEPGAVCKFMKMCPANNDIMKMSPQAECDVCQLVALGVDILLTQDPVVNELNKVLSEFCLVVPKSAKDTCLELVGRLAINIVILTVEELNPSAICPDLGYCSQSDAQVVKVAKSEVECKVCSLVAKEIDSLLKQGDTQQEIQDALKKVCHFLPSEFKHACNNLITQEGQKLINELVKGMDPGVVCSHIKACPGKSDIIKMSPEAECDVCQLVALGVDILLTQQPVVNELNKALSEFCLVVPKSAKDTCLDLVGRLAINIVILTVEELNPSAICPDLGYCSQSDAQVVKVAKSEVECKVCSLVAKEIDSLLKQGDTQQEIEDALKKVCLVLPFEFKFACNYLIAREGHKLINELVKGMDPGVVCSHIKACPGKSDIIKMSPEAECDVCQLVALGVDILLTQQPVVNELNKALSEFCLVVPKSAKDTCLDLVGRLAINIVILTVEELNPSAICPDLGYCSQSDTQVIKVAKSEVECKVCSLVAKEIDSLLKQGDTQQEIQDALKKVCLVLPSEFKYACNNLITQGGQILINELVKGMDPGVVCSRIKACPGKSEIIKMSPEAECDVCQLVALGVDILLTQQPVVDELNKALSEFCSVGPKSAKNTCLDLVGRLAINIVILTVEELNPSAICPDLGYCAQSNVQAVKVSDDVSCEVCKLVATELDTVLKEDATAAEIEKALMDVCLVLPSSAREECDTLITNYGQAIVDILVSELTPSQLCPELGLCPKELERIQFVGECEICDLVMKELKTMIGKESTEQEILRAVSEVCDVVRGQLRAQCGEYVRDYGSAVVSILVDDFVPDKVCATLGICRNTAVAYPPRKLHVGANDRCPICRSVIHTLDELLEKNATRAALDKELQKVCNYMPTSEVSECDSLVAEFYPVLMQYAENILDPSFICQHMKLCPTDDLTDDCRQGPSYWCRDIVTATKCDAFSHCVDHVWDERTIQ